MPTREFWQNIYEQTPEALPWDLGAVSAALRELFESEKPPAPQKILVPGCGRGHDAIHLAKLGHKVTAVDFVPEALAHAKQLAEKMNASLGLIEANVLALPNDWASSFDLVAEHTCYAAIHPDERDGYVRELLRVIRPDGRVLGVFFDEENFPGRSHPNERPPYPSTRAEIRVRFERAGFITRQIKPTPHQHGNKPLRQCVAVFQKK